MKKVLSGLGCVVLLLFAFGGCVAIFSNSDTQTTASNPSGSKDPAPDGSKTIPLATKANIRPDRALAVASLELVDQLSTGNEFVEPLSAKGGEIAVVRMSIENTGKESGDSIFTTAKLIDSQGRSYDQIQDVEEAGAVYLWEEAEGLASINDQLFPGGTAEIAKVFRVAPGAGGFTLVVNSLKFATE